MSKLNNILSNNNLENIVLLIDNILKINETKLEKYYKFLIYENKNFKNIMDKINEKFKNYLQSKINKSNLKKLYIQYINKYENMYNNKIKLLNKKIKHYKIKNNHYITILYLFKNKINKYDNLINKIDKETIDIISKLNTLDEFLNNKPNNIIKIKLLKHLKQLYKNKYKIHNKTNSNLEILHKNITYLSNIIDKNNNLINNLENDIKKNLSLLDENKNNTELKKNIDLLILFNKNAKKNLNLCLIQQTQNLEQLYHITNNKNNEEYNNLLKLQINKLNLLIKQITKFDNIESTINDKQLNKFKYYLLDLQKTNKDLLNKTVISTNDSLYKKIDLLINKFTIN